MNRRLLVLSLLAIAILTPATADAAKTPSPAAYQAYLNDSGISKIRATPGNLGVTVLRRADGDKTEFLVISIWESIEAVKSFAGEDYQKTVILPRDREYLLEVEPNVMHYDIVLEERK